MGSLFMDRSLPALIDECCELERRLSAGKTLISTRGWAPEDPLAFLGFLRGFCCFPEACAAVFLRPPAQDRVVDLTKRETAAAGRSRGLRGTTYRAAYVLNPLWGSVARSGRDQIAGTCLQCRSGGSGGSDSLADPISHNLTTSSTLSSVRRVGRQLPLKRNHAHRHTSRGVSGVGRLQHPVR